ncbi:hypothetical protein [Streptomyces phytophilus]|uniref:hypothetical protein n=1 Tax=Streptomyces phytophilus TaxID=722715 RepID=UPI0015F0D688|nr:hypothetical protein [Streptomyces phytophilus]
MAGKSIRVLTEGADYLAVSEPVKKVRDQATGEVATDRVTGEELYTVNLVEMFDGAADVLKVTLRASKLPAGLALGVPVRPVNLIATPWARAFNDGVMDGVAYRADTLELRARQTVSAAAAPASPAAAARPQNARPEGSK